LVLLCYVRGWLHLRKTLPRIINRRHMAAFIGGLAAIWIAAGSPLAVMDHQFLFIHMVQHLLLMAMAPPLILLGAPIPALLHGVPQSFGQAIVDPIHRSAPLHRIATIIGHPMFCWFAATITVFAWHLPSLFALGLHSGSWHKIESASFL